MNQLKLLSLEKQMTWTEEVNNHMESQAAITEVVSQYFLGHLDRFSLYICMCGS